MAASSVLTGNAMVVSYKVGVDSKGKDVFKNQTFKNIAPETTDDNLVQLSEEVSAILAYDVSYAEKKQTFILSRA